MKKPYRILAVDDHAIVRRGLLKLIENRRDITVVGEARTGNQLLEAAEELKPDLIVLDISIPEMNGLEAAKIIKRNQPETKILIVTMYDDEELLCYALSIGVEGYLLKADSPGEIDHALDTVLGGEMYLSPSLRNRVSLDLLRRANKGFMPYYGRLTIREREILDWVVEGKTSWEISKILGCSPRTVEHHRANIMMKLGIYRTVDLVKYAVRMSSIYFPQEEPEETDHELIRDEPPAI